MVINKVFNGIVFVKEVPVNVQVCTVTGVVGNVTYSISPALPAGLILDSWVNGPSGSVPGAIIRGTPTETSTYKDFTITATDQS